MSNDHVMSTAMHFSWSTLRYRTAQLCAALRAEISSVEQSLVAQILSPAEQYLFAAMPRYDQRHCLDVYYTLCAAGYDDPLLLRAALVHDCGKVDDEGRPMPLMWYLLVTLLKHIPPLYRMAAISGRGPFRAVQIYAEHAQRGAQMAQAAGSPPEIVATIRHYHDVAPQGRAALLQWADEQH
jgi:putative nucleotidyltransferase with HDIG domain